MALVRGGNAILVAAPKMHDLLLSVASEITGEPRDNLGFGESRISSRKKTGKSVTYVEIAQFLLSRGAETKVVRDSKFRESTNRSRAASRFPIGHTCTPPPSL